MSSTWLPRAAVVACMAVPFAVALGHGLGRSFITTSDMDIVVIYEALRLNQGLAQIYNDHTGYTSFVLLAWWFQLLKALGFLSVARLDQLPQLGPAFDSDYAALVEAGRVFSAFVASAFVAAMYVGLRQLSGSVWTAVVMTAIFSTSEGLARQTLILRTELAAALFTFVAFFLLLAAIRDPRRPILMFGVGLAAMLSLAAKMQSIFLLSAFPVLALAFSKSTAVRAGPTYDTITTLLWVLIAGALAIPAGFMLAMGVHANGHWGGYQFAFIAYGLSAMIAYRRLCNVPPLLWWRGFAALVAGLAIGHLFHLLYHTFGVTFAIANFVEHMAKFSAVGQGEMSGVLARLFHAIPATLVRHLTETPWPTRLIESLLIFMLVLRWFQGDHRAAICATLLFGIGLGFEIVCALRGFPPQYLVFTEGWTILTLAAAGMRGRWMAALLVLAVAGQVWHLGDATLVPVQDPANACNQAHYMTIRDAFCR